jgi:hypothetical protein
MNLRNTAVVLDDEHERIAGGALDAVGPGCGRGHGRFARVAPDREREVHARTVALALAVDADDAAHELDQALGDAQAQSGAAEAPGGAAVGLHELVEDHLLAAGGDPDAGILHLDPQMPELGMRARPHADLALGVNLRLLPTRLMRICFTLPKSPRAATSPPVWSSNVRRRPFCAAWTCVTV